MLPPSGPTVAPNATYSIVPRDVQTPYVQTFSMMVQRELGWATVLDVAYVGALGRQLPLVENINAASPGAGVDGMPFNVPAYGNRTSPIYLLTTGSTSNYNALQFNLTKRFSKNLALTFAYTFSKSLDYGGGLTPLQDNFDPRNNYGLSNFDRTNLLTISHVWQLPFGTGTNHLNSGVLGHILGPWQIDGIFRYASGSPWTPTADPGLCACPGNTVRADVVPSGYPTAIATIRFTSVSCPMLTASRTILWLNPKRVCTGTWEGTFFADPASPTTISPSSVHSYSWRIRGWNSGPRPITCLTRRSSPTLRSLTSTRVTLVRVLC
jgi:hypothetical protein